MKRKNAVLHQHHKKTKKKGCCCGGRIVLSTYTLVHGLALASLGWILLQAYLYHSSPTTTSKAASSPINHSPSNPAVRPDPRQQQRQPQPQYHMVFSTSCNDQQHWESLVFFYHAYKVQQPGTVTRILSGCTPPQMQHQRQVYHDYVQPLRQQGQPFNTTNGKHDVQFYLHFAPDYAKLQKAHNHPYKYMNKRTFGRQHKYEGRRSRRTPSSDMLCATLSPPVLTLCFSHTTIQNSLWIAALDGALSRQYVLLLFFFLLEHFVVVVITTTTQCPIPIARRRHCPSHGSGHDFVATSYSRVFSCGRVFVGSFQQSSSDHHFCPTRSSHGPTRWLLVQFLADLAESHVHCPWQ